MMEEVSPRPSVEYIPPLPPKVKQKAGSTTFTQINSDDSKMNGLERTNMESLGSMHSLVLNSKTPSATVFIAATQPERPPSTSSTDALNGPHVVTIRINTESDKPKAPKISSVHLKSDTDFDKFKINDIYKKNNSLVRINVEENPPKIIEEELKTDKPPFIYCSSYVNSMTNMVMSSGQCSPSDTLDSGTCSDLDGTPPPLPKKKLTKSTKKAVSVTLISSTNGANHDVDYEDNDSNISCDSLNSSELNGSVHADESHGEDPSKNEKKESSEPPAAPQMPAFEANTTNKDSSFLPQGLLQDIRDRTVKLSAAETESEPEQREANQNINENANLPKESAQLTSFRLVSQCNSEVKTNSDAESLLSASKTPLISESTYEERKKQDKIKQEQMCYSSNYFDTDKYYNFHLNEKQFDDVKSLKSVSGVSVNSESDTLSELEYFAGIKDYKSEEAPSTIRSSKGTIRGVKNRVRAGIATFLQIQSTTKVIQT